MGEGFPVVKNAFIIDSFQIEVVFGRPAVIDSSEFRGIKYELTEI